MRPTEPYITIHGDKVRESEKAVLFKVTAIRDHVLPEPLAPQWFPISQCSKMFWSDEPGKSWMMITEWIAGQKGISTDWERGEELPAHKDDDNIPEVY